MSLAEMRAELREMRKEHVKPVSRMKKGDIAAEIQKMKVHREETAAPAATHSVGAARMTKSAVESIKHAKAAEFPMQPSDAKTPVKAKQAPGKPAGKAAKAVKAKGAANTEAKKKSLTKEQLQAMLDSME